MRFMKKLFKPVSDQRINDAINIRNVRNMFAFSAVVCIVEAISLILYVIFNRNTPEFMRTLYSVSYCVIVCGVVAVLSHIIIRKYNREDSISDIQTRALVTLFYVLMSTWSIFVDTAHYGLGNQMLTFFIVQFCFVSFIIMPPGIGSILIALAFTALYLAIYVEYGAEHLQLQNYYIFAIIAVFSNNMQNVLLHRAEKSKLEIRELNILLQQEATIDDLTKLKNRKALRDDFYLPSGKKLSVMMADIDYFKVYNDTYGHVIGDEVLRMVASVTMEAFQGGEAYRYGGDEFLVIYPDCTEKAFEEKRQRWIEAVEAIRIPNVPQVISCSYGCAQCEFENLEDLEKAVKMADDRLYEAKKAR